MEDVLDAVGGAGADVIEVAALIHRQGAVLASRFESVAVRCAGAAGAAKLDDRRRALIDLVGTRSAAGGAHARNGVTGARSIAAWGKGLDIGPSDGLGTRGDRTGLGSVFVAHNCPYRSSGPPDDEAAAMVRLGRRQGRAIESKGLIPCPCPWAIAGRQPLFGAYCKAKCRGIESISSWMVELPKQYYS